MKKHVSRFDSEDTDGKIKFNGLGPAPNAKETKSIKKTLPKIPCKKSSFYYKIKRMKIMRVIVKSAASNDNKYQVQLKCTLKCNIESMHKCTKKCSSTRLFVRRNIDNLNCVIFTIYPYITDNQVKTGKIVLSGEP